MTDKFIEVNTMTAKTKNYTEDNDRKTLTIIELKEFLSMFPDDFKVTHDIHRDDISFALVYRILIPLETTWT